MKGVFFLYFACEEGKITHSLFGPQSGCLAAAYAIEKFFYNNGVLSKCQNLKSKQWNQIFFKNQTLLTLSYPDRIVI